MGQGFKAVCCADIASLGKIADVDRHLRRSLLSSLLISFYVKPFQLAHR
jgi:hypothetical protein